MAFALGGIVGTFAVDLTRFVTGSALHAYALVFLLQAVLFGVAALLASRLTRKDAGSVSPHRPTKEAIPDGGY